MKTKGTMIVAIALCGAMQMNANAGQARTSAAAGATGYGTGGAVATADYTGNGPAITRTRTNSGRVNLARGISVGVDRNGLDVSASYAVAGQVGPALGGTFNMHVDRNGQTTISGGRVVADGDPRRGVSVGGGAGRIYGTAPYAVSAARGRTGPRGNVAAETFSRRGLSLPRDEIRTVQRRTVRRARW